MASLGIFTVSYESFLLPSAYYFLSSGWIYKNVPLFTKKNVVKNATELEIPRQLSRSKISKQSIGLTRSMDLCCSRNVSSHGVSQDFIFVAILQGIGVLGLPNSLHRSGIQPMIVTTAFSFILEVMVSYTFLIITQKAIAIKYFHKESQNILDDESESEEIVLDDKQREKIDKNKNVNTHLLSALFLPKYLRITFDLIMLLKYFLWSIIVALAASQAYSGLILVSAETIAPIFIIITAVCYIFLKKPLMIILPTLSFVRSGLIIVMIIIFFGAVVAAKFTTGVINILWCYAVLYVVPQTCSPMIRDGISLANMTESGIPCQLTLKWAAENGKISTVPLSIILKDFYPQYAWLALVIRLFIVLSTTLSYLTNGMSASSWMSGMLVNIRERMTNSKISCSCTGDEDASKDAHYVEYQEGNFPDRVLDQLIQWIYVALIILIVMLNPKGFFILINHIETASKYIVDSIFVLALYRTSAVTKYRNISVPISPSANWFYVVVFLTIIHAALFVYNFWFLSQYSF
ncbi:uncharacterized protein TRIADDRAFT_51586 [Trichoplax adhaerens]|uniref:Amino acid transporter transmembrane domain-containing protein n=1 Tax=Trichoplax adhaerens TaxID=10228 RepID=B3RK12_TRIAD|nr:predicted protein [Trichoplax adhaerens]EDV29354.1 predicted protein [Trichoplax adhaerens]|eukprot:XP_002108556.1 predicted protein [Trichoplax adhaerens]